MHRLNPLPQHMLDQRIDCMWERDWPEGGQDDTRVNNAIKFAEDQLTRIFVAQELGGDDKDEEFMDAVDLLHDTLRDGLTRQDLIRALLHAVSSDALDRAEAMIQDHRDEVKRMCKPVRRTHPKKSDPRPS